MSDHYIFILSAKPSLIKKKMEIDDHTTPGIAIKNYAHYNDDTTKNIMPTPNNSAIVIGVAITTNLRNK